MKIGAIGAGKIGGTLGAKWAAAGHDVVYGLRNPSKKPGAKSFDDAIAGADVVLLAIPGSAVVDFVRQHANKLDGKIVIDATNNFGAASFNSWPEVSQAIHNAKLYRAFNCLGFDVFADPVLGGEQVDLFYAGPETDKDDVEQLIRDVGLRPIWVGGSDQVDVIDGVLKLWSTLAQKRGRRIAFKLISD